MYCKRVKERIMLETEYIIQTECTIKELTDYINDKSQCGKKFSVTEKTVRDDLLVKLPEISWKYLKVRRILNKQGS